MFTKVMNVILLICAIALFVMAIIETGRGIATGEWKPTEVYEFTNKNIDWS